MSAPAHEKTAEQDTQPLPIAGTENLPPGRNWLMSEWSVLLIPGTILAAIGIGELVRSYVLLTDADRSDFAIAANLLVLAVSVTVLILGRIALREDGKTTSGGGM